MITAMEGTTTSITASKSLFYRNQHFSVQTHILLSGTITTSILGKNRNNQNLFVRENLIALPSNISETRRAPALNLGPVRGRFRLYSRRREGGIWAANLRCVAFIFLTGVCNPISRTVLRANGHVWRLRGQLSETVSTRIDNLYALIISQSLY